MGKPTKPDVRQLADEQFAEADFPASRADFRVHFDAEIHEHIVSHAEEDKSVEIGGVLVGRWLKDANGPYVEISRFIRCDDATSKSGEVTFTHESWNTINREMDTRFVDLNIVGWYHSHPGFGVFLSERDIFIHEHFFSNPGQVALVVDPVAGTEGVFVWRKGKPKPCPHYWVGQKIVASADSEQSAGKEPRERGNSATAESPPPLEYLSWIDFARRALPFVLIFLVGYLLAGVKSTFEQQRMYEGMIAHFATWKCLKPELRENLDKVNELVGIAQAEVRQLSKEHIATAEGENAEKLQARWNQVAQAFQVTRYNLRVLGEVYGLDPVETAAMKAVLADKLIELGKPKEKKSDGQKSSDKEKKPALPPKEKAEPKSKQPEKPNKEPQHKN